MANHLLENGPDAPEFEPMKINVGDVIEDRIREGEKDYTVTAVYNGAGGIDRVFGVTCGEDEGIFIHYGFYKKG